jgi:hypothetical protein
MLFIARAYRPRGSLVLACFSTNGRPNSSIQPETQVFGQPVLNRDEYSPDFNICLEFLNAFIKLAE